MSQSQRGGIGSQNVQVGTVHVGLSYSEIKALALDLWNANFPILQKTAFEKANERAEEIREEIMRKIAEKGEEAAKSFSHPEKQVALVEAQKSYAISGDEELKAMLAASVANLAGEAERSIKSIVISEAIKTMPNLTKRQLRVLATTLVVRHYALNSYATIELWLDGIKRLLGGNVNDVICSLGDLRHIQYVGCGSVSIRGLEFYGMFEINYPAFISKGYSVDEMAAAFGDWPIPSDALCECLNDPKKIQIAALNKPILLQKFGDWPPEKLQIAEKKLVERLMQNHEINNRISQINSDGKHFVDFWSSDPGIRNLELTSVGIAVAHTYLELEQKFPPLNDLLE